MEGVSGHWPKDKASKIRRAPLHPCPTKKNQSLSWSHWVYGISQEAVIRRVPKCYGNREEDARHAEDVSERWTTAYRENVSGVRILTPLCNFTISVKGRQHGYENCQTWTIQGTQHRNVMKSSQSFFFFGFQETQCADITGCKGKTQAER